MIKKAQRGDRVRVLNRSRGTSQGKITVNNITGSHTWDFDEMGMIGIVTHTHRRRGSILVNVRPENSDDNYGFSFLPSSLVRAPLG